MIDWPELNLPPINLPVLPSALYFGEPRMTEREKFDKWWKDNMPLHYEMNKEQSFWAWEARAKLDGKVAVRVRRTNP